MDDKTKCAKNRRRELPLQKLLRQDSAYFRRRLLRWYNLDRRDLPWRKTADPYRIWISEVMLQQTRVQAVIPYYENFLRHFPDVKKLARASETELLSCWSGLGYYSRARNLQRAARVMVREHGGRFPRNFHEVLRLPGIGRYTASAVLCLAYGVPLPVLDGNVCRVLSRLYAVAADPKTASGNQQLLELASGLMSSQRPGDFNQAMMELGATVCLPQQPKCGQCPVRRNCLAYSRGTVKEYPLARCKGKPVQRQYVAALAQDQSGRILLVRRPNKDKWLGGFWELPMWEPSESAPPPGLALEQRLGIVQHSITDNRLEIAIFCASVRGRRHRAQWRWIPTDEFGKFPITTITRKALALVKVS
ncbi:MAG: A/G-specific adenine glycosylase [Acidobacteria bacterium]|nr:A/G-specific adenine glycosylase [Acidobacteriota bacterium]